jgi:hypothetical protein
MKIKLHNDIIDSRYFYHIVILIILSYLIFGVGLHGDDYAEISGMDGYSLWEFLNPDPSKHNIQILGLPNFYTFWWAYPVLGYEYQWLYDVIKIVVHAVSIYLIYNFAQDYLAHDRALLMSLIFVLYPLHDTTTYWYMTLYYVTVPAIILYAHSLIRHNRIGLGLFLLFLGSMWHYASPPWVFGMAMVFVFEKKIKKAIIFLIPGFVYIFYYFWFKFSYPNVERRINPDLDLISFIKHMALQFLSFIESAIGPSFFLKIFYAINSISFMSMLGVLIVVIFLFKSPLFSLRKRLYGPLFFGLISVVLFSFAMFSLTGLYTHSAFSLSNRTTIYGSLLIAFLLAALLPANKKSIILLLLIFIAPVFGLSDHWKSWNTHQKIIIENIQTNSLLGKVDKNSTLIVTGNLWSNLGPFSHIGFFSMPWTVDALFKDYAKSKEIVALTPYMSLRNGFIFDEKFGGKYFLHDKIYVYNTENDSILEIDKLNIKQLIMQQPKIVRHWSQLVKEIWIQDIIIWLSPRLSYLFKN